MLRPRVHITYDVLRTLHADVPTFSTHHSPLITHHSLLIAQRHEFNPNVVAMAERILITVWMISFQVSLFFIGSLVKGFVFSLLALRPSNVMLNLFQHLSAEKDE